MMELLKFRFIFDDIVFRCFTYFYYYFHIISFKLKTDDSNKYIALKRQYICNRYGLF